MPAGMVRPRASQVPHLGAGAVVAYRQSGWRITVGGRPDTGQRTGPCVRCDALTVRYGPGGRPLCNDCGKEREERRDG